MPSFTLPPLKEPEKVSVPEPAMTQAISAWERRVSVPVNQEILDALRIDDKAEIMLRGTIKEVRSLSQTADDTATNSNSITIEITEVECHTDDDERFREDVKRGYEHKGMMGKGM